MTTGNAKTNIDMSSLTERLADAEIPGCYATFTEEEAALLGAFDEDALSLGDAMAASFYNPDIIAEVDREMRGQ
jgi:hypothetical protein